MKVSTFLFSPNHLTKEEEKQEDDNTAIAHAGYQKSISFSII